MTIDNGPYGLEILNCKSTIEHEKKTIEWCRKALVEGRTPYIESIYQGLLEEAQIVLSQAEEELSEWIKKHYRAEAEKDSA